MTNEDKSLFRVALAELGDALARMDESHIDAACAMLAGAKQIAVYGCGREALQVKGFAMRLYHLGLPVSVVGGMTTPPLGKGDVFLVSFRAWRNLDRTHFDAGGAGSRRDHPFADSQIESSAAGLADFVLLIPAQTMADDQGPERISVLPMGSVVALHLNMRTQSQ